MQFLAFFLAWISVCAGLWTSACFFSAQSAFALSEGSAIHFTGDKTFWDRKNDRVTLIGNAAVRQSGETITADHIVLDQVLRTLDAKGNCVYIAADTVIRAEEMHFNLDTRTGTIVAGRVSSSRFTLSGEIINRLSATRYQTHQGEYSTCLDCPQSWTLHGDDMDMEIDGYGHFKNVIAKVKDAPVFWFPYLIVPLKTKRQTGFLFPKLGFTDKGFNYVQPFFWAISDSTDMTFSFGKWGGHGPRGEWEGRYAFTDRSKGKANAFWLRDKTFLDILDETKIENESLRAHRWALKVDQAHELPFRIDQKLSFTEVSDNLYVNRFGDVGNNNDAYLSSILSFSHSSDYLSIYGAGQRFRNLIINDPLEFDPKTVQVYPTAGLTTKERPLFGSPIAGGVNLGVSNFTRSLGAFDLDAIDQSAQNAQVGRAIVPGKDPIRKATRASVTPSMYTTLKPGGIFSIVPSAEYRNYYYNFHNELRHLSRGYLLLRTDLSFQLDRIYETDDPDYPRVKHLIRPLLSYNRIPHTREDLDHPFLQQIRYAQNEGVSGYNFDNNDIIPLDTSRTYQNYFVPLGNSLTYGVVSQLIRRKGPVDGDGSYQRTVEFRANQTYNFREFVSSPSNSGPQPFSRLESHLLLTYDQWSGSTDYNYYPYAPVGGGLERHEFNTNFQYTIERAVHQNVLAFQRSFNLAYQRARLGSYDNWRESVGAGLTYSLSDYVMPAAQLSYDLKRPKGWLGIVSSVDFQSPSQCWKLQLTGDYRRCRDNAGSFCTTFAFNFTWNLAGQGFMGFDEAPGGFAQ